MRIRLEQMRSDKGEGRPLARHMRRRDLFIIVKRIGLCFGPIGKRGPS